MVKVTIALQSESKTRTQPLSPGLSLSSLDSGMIQEYGIEFYSMNVVIPGAMLLGSPSATSSSGTSSSGMSSLGL